MLQKRLLNLKLDAEQKVADYVAEAKNLAFELEKAGEAVSDELLQTIIVGGLPVTKYKSFVMQWHGKAKEQRSVQKLEDDLISAEELIGQEDDEIVALSAATTKATVKKHQQEKNRKKGTAANRKAGKKFSGDMDRPYEASCSKYAGTMSKSKKSRVSGLTESKEQEGDVFFARVSIAEANAASDSDIWLADSGASFHMS